MYQDDGETRVENDFKHHTPYRSRVKFDGVEDDDVIRCWYPDLSKQTNHYRW